MTLNWWPHNVVKTYFEGPLGEVLKTSWQRPESASQGRSLNVRLGCPLDIISKRPQDVRFGHLWNTQIGSLGDVPGTLEGDVLGTNIFRLGSRQRSDRSRSKFLVPFHPLTNLEIRKYYLNEPKFIGFYSRNNWSKIKYGGYIINLDEYESIGTHWIALYINAENVTQFNQ